MTVGITTDTPSLYRIGTGGSGGVHRLNRYQDNPAAAPADFLWRGHHFQSWLHSKVRITASKRKLRRVPVETPKGSPKKVSAMEYKPG